MPQQQIQLSCRLRLLVAINVLCFNTLNYLRDQTNNQLQLKLQEEILAMIVDVCKEHSTIVSKRLEKNLLFYTNLRELLRH